MVVVGAGPTGLSLAALLGARGLDVVVLERHHEPYPLPRAVHLDDEVYRLLHEVGVGEEFAAVTRPAAGLRLLDERHRPLATFSRTDPLPSGLPQANMFDQPDLERLLRANVKRFPSVELVGGVEVGAVQHGAADVMVTGVRDGRPLSVRAAYVVGCDGANSVVREAVGADWVDLGFEQRWLVVDVRTDVELDAWEGVHQVCDRHRAGTYMRIGADRYRWEFEMLDGETVADLSARPALRGLLAPWAADVPDERLDVVRCVEYTFRARAADRWREGRVLLAGDAAHTTPPFIGQGLCAGQRDAANLAWKVADAVRLDAVAAAPGAGPAGELARGRAERLLSSYEAERRPHAVAIIGKAVRLGQIMTGGGRAATVLRRWVLPRAGSSGTVVRAVLDSRSPALVAGPLVERSAPKSLRGGLLPLVPVTGPDGAPVLVDRVLGDAPVVLALPGVDEARVRLDGARGWRLDPAAGDGERALAAWIASGGADWVRVDPDRVVRRAGRGG
ncbi:MAG: 3-(3-hydroxyphenyl)propionate hydroxylase [Nocardioides sp.]|nr:3-(3-hydroxyphenyl)propionate hydroxylase [Nocardioides sp.]